ncbi:transcription antitermination protein NusB [Mycoplasma iguanae]|uniref:Transcription antitermination protein NusB n=1 Tax=Mycoplasma iguanae TaxID=292461 RepID=A0ABY5R9T4_9MOLU|nr:transcription antitermination protein NusB [Mycoplasma iguanae]UVD81947.1 transcription antitermination protein NusB [Mycoplasma iguanae]
MQEQDSKKYSQNSISKRRSSLEKVIAIIYMFEVQNIENNFDLENIWEDFQLTELEIKDISLIKKHYFFFRKNIEKLLKPGWNWKRISPLIRASLIEGSLQLFVTNKSLIINEIVAIVKEYTLEGENEYKFVNWILDELSKKYHDKK